MAYEKADPEIWEKKDRAIIAECAVKFAAKIKPMGNFKMLKDYADWAYNYIIEKREGYNIKTLTLEEKVKMRNKLVKEVATELKLKSKIDKIEF